MNYKFRILAVALFLAATTMLPLVKADEWNKETRVTFSDPVAVPGQVLPPGRYVFKLADKQSDRHIVVQIFTEDQSELVATIEAIPAYRLEPTGVTLMTFEEGTSGSPEAVKRWFYPGDLVGVAFVYPDDRQ
jgi:hypothetical protein